MKKNQLGKEASLRLHELKKNQLVLSPRKHKFIRDLENNLT